MKTQHTPGHAKQSQKQGGIAMQRRHFELIAGIIAELNPISPAAKDYKQALVEHFIDELAKTNPLFDRARFVKACNKNA